MQYVWAEGAGRRSVTPGLLSLARSEKPPPSSLSTHVPRVSCGWRSIPSLANVAEQRAKEHVLSSPSARVESKTSGSVARRGPRHPGVGGCSTQNQACLVLKCYSRAVAYHCFTGACLVSWFGFLIPSRKVQGSIPNVHCLHVALLCVTVLSKSA